MCRLLLRRVRVSHRATVVRSDAHHPGEMGGYAIADVRAAHIAASLLAYYYNSTMALRHPAVAPTGALVYPRPEAFVRASGRR